MKGDRVEVVVDTGGESQTFVIDASRSGRRVEVSSSRGMIEVTEVTRSGSAVRSGRFMASRVIALVEHPASDRRDAAEGAQPRRRRRSTSAEQASLL